MYEEDGSIMNNLLKKKLFYFLNGTLKKPPLLMVWFPAPK